MAQVLMAISHDFANMSKCSTPARQVYEPAPLLRFHAKSASSAPTNVLACLGAGAGARTSFTATFFATAVSNVCPAACTRTYGSTLPENQDLAGTVTTSNHARE